MAAFFVEHFSGPPTQKDLDSVHKMNLESFKQTREMTFEQFTAFLSNPDVIFVVARDAETKEIIGKQTMYVIMLDDSEIKTYLEQVTTDSRYLKMGIARAIWSKLIDIARAKNVEFSDWTSGDSKQAAQGFYDSIPGCARRETNNFRFKLR